MNQLTILISGLLISLEIVLFSEMLISDLSIILVLKKLKNQTNIIKESYQDFILYDLKFQSKYFFISDWKNMLKAFLFVLLFVIFILIIYFFVEIKINEINLFDEKINFKEIYYHLIIILGIIFVWIFSQFIIIKSILNKKYKNRHQDIDLQKKEIDDFKKFQLSWLKNNDNNLIEFEIINLNPLLKMGMNFNIRKTNKVLKRFFSKNKSSYQLFKIDKFMSYTIWVIQIFYRTKNLEIIVKNNQEFSFELNIKNILLHNFIVNLNNIENSKK